MQAFWEQQIIYEKDPTLAKWFPFYTYETFIWNDMDIIGITNYKRQFSLTPQDDKVSRHTY